MTLTKANIVESLAEQNGYTKKQSVNMIETLLEIIKRTLRVWGRPLNYNLSLLLGSFVCS